MYSYLVFVDAVNNSNKFWSETLSQYKSVNISSSENKKVIRTVKTIRSINFEEIHHNQLEEVRQALQSKLQEIDKIIELSNRS